MLHSAPFQRIRQEVVFVMGLRKLKPKDVSGLSRVGIRFVKSLSEKNSPAHDAIRTVKLQEFLRVLRALELVEHVAEVEEVIKAGRLPSKIERRRVDKRRGGRVPTRPHCNGFKH